MRPLLSLLALAALLQAPAVSVIQGDPPFLLEDGWDPLLDGSSLAGWHACNADAVIERKGGRAGGQDRRKAGRRVVPITVGAAGSKRRSLLGLPGSVSVAATSTTTPARQ